MVCMSITAGRLGGVSARVVRPTGPVVASVATGNSANTPSTRSSAMTPWEMIQTASVMRV
jgi:hypothetical protein